MTIQARVRTLNHDESVKTTYEDIPDITYKFIMSDSGNASWSVPFTHPDFPPPTVEGPDFGPKRTDYRIGVSQDNGVNWEAVHAGFCSTVTLENDVSQVRVTGVDWLDWLNQPVKWGAYLQPDMGSWTQADYIMWWPFGTPQTDVITDLIGHLNGADLTLSPSFNGAGWAGALMPEPIILILGDTTTILDKVKDIGALQDPYGFEFWVEEDKTIQLWATRVVTEAMAYSAGIVTSYFAPSLENIVSVNWTNNGPKAATTIGMPSTFPAIRGFSTYANSVLTYRDWWTIEQLNINSLDIHKYQALTNAATGSLGQLNRGPHKTLNLTIQPEIASTLEEPYDDLLKWHRCRLGDVISFDSEDWFMPYWRLEGLFRVRGQELVQSSASGDWVCNLELEQLRNPALTDDDPDAGAGGG
jgi:hypothetical protein